MRPADLHGLLRWAVLWSVVAYILISPSLSWGHGDEFSVAPFTPDSPMVRVAAHPLLAPPRPVSPSGLASAFPLALGLGAVLAFRVVKRRRQAIALGLTLAVGLFVFDTAIHSVHHLFEPEKTPQCFGFSASQHLSGGPAVSWNLPIPGVVLELLPPVNLDLPLLTSCCRPDQPRAPPMLTA